MLDLNMDLVHWIVHFSWRFFGADRFYSKIDMIVIQMDAILINSTDKESSQMQVV